MKASFVVADLVQKAGGADRLLEQSGKSNMRTGALLFCLGAGVTGLIYLVGSIPPESHGGSGFFLFMGPMAFGALQFFRGLGQRRKARHLAEQATPPDREGFVD
jgi:hypothetical protein